MRVRPEGLAGWLGGGRPSRARSFDGAVEALAVIARAHGHSVRPDALKHQLAATDGTLTLARLAAAAQTLHLLAVPRQCAFDALVTARKPVIVCGRDDKCRIAVFADGDTVKLLHPHGGAVTRMAKQDFCDWWTGDLVEVSRSTTAVATHAQFATTAWITDVIARYKGPLSAILASSLILQLTGLASPLLLQVIIDKVLVHRSESTLVVVCAALVLTALLEAVVTWLRGFSIAHASARIDAQLGSNLFAKLLSLPLSYFDARPAGQTVARVRELENIRTFLTSQGATSVVDSIFSLVYLIVLAFYSVKLTLIVILALPLFFGFATLVRVPLRDFVRQKFQRGADMQQHLIESILGSHTIKALSIEPTTLMKWDERLVAYVQAATKVSALGALGSAGIQLISKLCTAAILFAGAKYVMDGDLTVGALVAFNMIAGQLMAPTIRLSNAWQDLQQVQISLGRIGDILLQEPEFQPEGTFDLPGVQGAITFSSVVFRYAPTAPEVLKGVSLAIPAGQVVGIIGPSGSGKSTLARIVQRLHPIDSGRILIDGEDVAQTPTTWFRRNIGVVLQETYLLNRSIHDNIALANPALSRQEVVALAKLAGADEFISQLRRGYDTMIQERGANLSGGQRQRIAIARALAADPKILILDEATSALDYDSEQAIQRNMRSICAGRTVIIIAHRLAAVRDCQRIIGIRDGRILEDGPPDELAADPLGLYRRMIDLQAEMAAA